MNILTSNAIESSGKILGILAEKQEMISTNLANMHTPGYVRKDINFADYISGESISSLEAKVNKKYGKQYFANEVGGKVSTQQELAEIQKNYLNYSMATRRLSSAVQEIKTVTQVGK